MTSTPHKIAFFYIDLVNSTEYKYSGDRQRWMAVFNSFYFDFPQYLNDQSHAFTERYGLSLDPLKYWKGLGDSQIYAQRYKNTDEAFGYSVIFYAALIDYDRFLHNRFGIRVKACAWNASFPRINLEVKTPAGLDYIGPDMDLGFRLADVATPSRMFIAMDLAYELSQSQWVECMFFHHVGWRKLKGIHKNIPYPILQFTNHKEPTPLPIWERSLNDFAKRYHETNALNPEELRELIDTYKRDLRFQPELV